MIKEYIWLIIGAVIVVWLGIGFVYWMNHPDLTQMQVFLKMIGYSGV